TAPESRETLARIADATTGKSYDTGVIEGIASLMAESAGALGQAAIETSLGAGKQALTPIEVAPHSTGITVTFLRLSAGATFELFDPRGARADAASNPKVQIFETPSAAVLTVAEPEAGTWSLRATGADSDVRAAVKIDNPLQLTLLPQPPVPIGEKGVLWAAAAVDGKPVPLPGASVEATVRGTDGKAVVYKLLDDGRGVDMRAGDGVFAVSLPASESQALFDVGLKLSWPNYASVIRGTGTIKTEPFPTISVKPLDARGVREGSMAVVGRIDAWVSDYPYPVNASDLSVRVTGTGGASVLSSLRPINPLADGTAWQFQVLAATVKSGGYRVSAELKSSHLGRTFVASAAATPSIVELLPPPPVPGTPAWIYAGAATGGLAVLIALAILLNTRRTRPFGYLYDDKGRMLLDFAAIKQSGPRKLLARNYVACSAVAGFPAGSGAFVFHRHGAELRYAGRAQSLRVNGRPAGNRVGLGQGTWLGIGGRLVTFEAQRRRFDMATAAEAASPIGAKTLVKEAPVRRVQPGFIPGRPTGQPAQASDAASAERGKSPERPSGASHAPAPAD
ncbi:MAG: hypothetical protein HY682_03005, partial [Chloroflexi bacterium]|nr:hypothetical protein [Chloroflexota bacterium]